MSNLTKQIDSLVIAYQKMPKHEPSKARAGSSPDARIEEFAEGEEEKVQEIVDFVNQGVCLCACVCCVPFFAFFLEHIYIDSIGNLSPSLTTVICRVLIVLSLLHFM
jgi:hypothetical protein